jgi:hypothetical protein
VGGRTLTHAQVPDGLIRALAALGECGVPVAVLREFEVSKPLIEVDLLVPSPRRRELRSALVPCGFAPLRAWGHRGHDFYLAYSAPDRLWLKLDFVTRVAGVDGERALAGRRRVDGLPRLDQQVEAALLLLHCIVDKHGRPGRHETTLRRLAGAGTTPPPGAPAPLQRLWPELERAVAGPGAIVPDALVRSVTDVVTPDRARHMRRDRWLRRASRVRRALRPAAVLVVVLDATLDCSGGATGRLVRELGPGVRCVSLPRAQGPLAVVRRRLRVELERRRYDGPVVVDAGPRGTGLAQGDVTVMGSVAAVAETASAAQAINEAVWSAYRRRLLGRPSAASSHNGRLR